MLLRRRTASPPTRFASLAFAMLFAAVFGLNVGVAGVCLKDCCSPAAGVSGASEAPVVAGGCCHLPTPARESEKPPVHAPARHCPDKTCCLEALPDAPALLLATANVPAPDDHAPVLSRPVSDRLAEFAPLSGLVPMGTLPNRGPSCRVHLVNCVQLC